MGTNTCRPAARRSHRRTPAHLLATLFLALLAAGCGSDGDSMAAPGGGSSGGTGGGGTGVVSGTATFSVTVSGAESFVSTGDLAWSGGSAAENGWEVQLAVVDNANPLRSLAIEGEGDRPGPGTYTIVSVAGPAGSNEFYGRCMTLAGEIYYATSGTLTIDSSSDAIVEGTFAFGAESSTTATVNVSGSFRADDLLDE